MLYTNNFNAAQAAYNRIADTKLHFRRNGASICELFTVFDAPAGFYAFCELHGFLSCQHPDPRAVKAALQQIEAALSIQSKEVANIASHDRGFDADAALRWHGARISELLGRFKNAV